jgi:hypothetical protein
VAEVSHDRSPIKVNSVDQDRGCGDAARVQLYGTVTGPPGVPGEPNRLYAQLRVEPMTGIEPAYSAWEAIFQVRTGVLYRLVNGPLGYLEYQLQQRF